MVFGFVAIDGSIMAPYFIEAGLKINTTEYLKILKNVLEVKFGLNHVVHPQNSALCHASKATQSFLLGRVLYFTKAEV
uniref:Putative LOC100197594 [Hydra vulgaris] n=1 Tax=Lepeophtheirus salmonis TaxID=72036 RepID=A0A0K2TXL6_LEPSM